MQRKKLSFTEVYDIRALRVLVPTRGGLLCRFGLDAQSLGKPTQ